MSDNLFITEQEKKLQKKKSEITRNIGLANFFAFLNTIREYWGVDVDWNDKQFLLPFPATGYFHGGFQRTFVTELDSGQKVTHQEDPFIATSLPFMTILKWARVVVKNDTITFIEDRKNGISLTLQVDVEDKAQGMADTGYLSICMYDKKNGVSAPVYKVPVTRN